MKHPGQMVLLVGAVVAAGLSGARASDTAGLCKPVATASETVLCGVLPNGMQYVVQHNATPPGTAAIDLLIHAGSMQEADDQHGAAHILEHVAFHGSAHVSDGDTIRMLQRLGLRLGADVNASTGARSTSYRFDMTKNDTASLDTGLMLAREIAGELTLAQRALDTERPIVLAEARGRPESADAGLALVHAEVGDHPYGRLTIGTAAEIQTAGLKRVRDFYDAYYRPERATLIVVGDIDPAAVEAKIRARFGDWRGRGEPGGDPDAVIHPATQNGTAVVPGVDESYLRLMWTRSNPQRAFDDEAMKRHWIERVGDMALTQRIRDQNTAAGLPMGFFGGVIRDDVPGVARSVGLQANGVHDLPRTTELLLHAWQQFSQFGLTQGEIDRSAMLARSNLEHFAGTTQNTPSIAGSIAWSVEAGMPYRTRNQQLQQFDDAVKDLTAARANAVLRETIPAEPPVALYFVQTEPAGGVKVLDEAMMAAALGTTVAAYVPPAIKVWTHTDFGTPGAVVERSTDPTFGIVFVRFANGVRLTIKPTKFEAGALYVAVRFGHGVLDQPKDRLTASDFATALLDGAGAAGMTDTDLSAALAGHHAGAFADTQEDAFVLGSGIGGLSLAQASSLDLEMQVLAAKLSQPHWQTEKWANLIEIARTGYAGEQTNPGAVLASAGRAAMHPGDMRWEESTPDVQRDWKAGDAIAFLEPIMRKAPLQVIVAGDIDVDKVIAATAKTFGALPQRDDRPEPPDLRTVPLPPATPAPIVVYHTGPRDQAVVSVAWTTTDAFEDHRRTQAARVLTDILRSRAFEELRGKLGLTYSPGASAQFSGNLPGYGFIAMTVASRPEDVDRVFSTIDAIAGVLAAHDVSQDELDRAVKPEIEQDKRAQQTNPYWLINLRNAQTDKRRLTFIASEIPDLQSLTPADIRASAQRWLVKERRLQMKVVPQDEQAVR